MTLRATAIVVFAGISFLSCTSARTSPTWMEFEYTGMWAWDGTFVGSISQSGVLRIAERRRGTEPIEHVAYLTAGELRQLRAAIQEVVLAHGNEIDLVQVEDGLEYSVVVRGASGTITFRARLPENYRCLDAHRARSVAELWNNILRTIESPKLRTRESLIVCGETGSGNSATSCLSQCVCVSSVQLRLSRALRATGGPEASDDVRATACPQPGGVF